MKIFFNNHIIFLLLVCFFNTSLIAQEETPFSLNYEYYSGISFYDDADNKAFNTNIQYVEAALTIPIPVKEKTLLLNTIRYNYLNADLDSYNMNEYTFAGEVNLFSYDFAILTKIKNYKFLLSTGLRYGADCFSALKLDDVVSRNALLIFKEYEDKKIKKAGIGIVSSTDYGTPTTIPLLIFKIDFSKSITLNSMFPLNTNINWEINQKSNIGILYKSWILSYRLTRNYDNIDASHIKSRRSNLGLCLEQQVYNQIHLSIYSGINLTHNFFIFDSNNENINELYAGKNFFVNLKLSLKISR